MTQLNNGDKVSVHYTGKLNDGTVFDSTEGEEPFVFTLGEDDLIDGFVSAIKSMIVGEKKTVTIGVEDAYGLWHEDMVIEVPRSEMPADLELAVGDELEVTDEEEEPMLVMISEMTDETVTLDGNPPLAGQDLIFDLELVAIN